MVYEKKVQITAEYSDYTIRLGNYQFFYLLQNAMIGGFDAQGVGNKGLREKCGGYWAVTKTKLKIFRKPDWNEEITLKAKSFDDGRLRVNVATEILSAGNELLALGTQELCILDLDTHRVKRLTDTCLPLGENKDTLAMEFEKFSMPDEILASYEYIVRSQNIDMSRHVNNVEYIRMAMDLFTVDELCEKDPFVMEVHYIGECREGEKLICQRADAENKSFINISKDGKKVFEMKISFADK